MNRKIHYIYSISLLLLLEAATSTFAQTIKGNIYGGGNLSQVVGSTTINIKSGSINSETADDGNIYGGGLGASAVLTGNTTIIVTGGTVSKDVYGGGALANITGSTVVNVSGGSVTQDVYGGGALANVSANTSVNLTGGSIRSSYGGGLGSNEVAALIGGDATTTLNGSIVLGSVFGCNNLNGTPQGHAKVHVLSTAERDGQSTEDYDVVAVYGGGNLAAYEPTNADDFAEVLIENCDNSIEYVYGGGNAAPVPATQVTIKGANAIDNAFAGGNGAGADNPGADIGYKGFFRKGAATEYGTGIATINVQGGTIHHVYGGSNTLGYIKDHAVVNVNAAGTCPMDVAELYGGGKMAPGKAAQINITCTGEGKIDNVYGGAHMADLTGDITLNINGGNIGNAFGGNNESGTINGAITVNVNWDIDACGTNSLNNVYGAGNKADYTGNPAVNILKGTVKENVFGGGLEATVTGNPTVTVNGGTVTLGAYGGGALADVDGTTTVNIISGIVGNAYGGGLGQLANDAVGTEGDPEYVPAKEAIAATVTGNANVTVSGGTTTNVFGCNNLNGSPEGDVTVTIKETANVTNVYGGGNQAPASVSPVVNINGGTSDKVYGGGYGATAVLTGDPTVNVSAGTVSHDVFGGGALADVTGSPSVNVIGGTVTHDVYGGGALANVSGSTIVNLAGGAVGNAYGGGLGQLADAGAGKEAVAATVTGDANVTVSGGTTTNVFGCNNLNGSPEGDVTVTINGTANVTNVYGGGNQAAASVSPVVNINGGTSDKVYGGGYGATAVLTGDPTVNVSGGTVSHDVYGGGALANVTGDPTVNVTGGTVTHDVYGGGALADVDGSTTVNLTGGAVGGAYGGALGSAEIEAKVYGDTYVHLDGSKVTETGIFGANNLNGTPTGHVKVHVTKTTPRDGQVAYNPEHPEISNSYDVPAVYGGGNKAAYVPTGSYNTDGCLTDKTYFAEVLIEGCGNSIDYVYGGGNAAPVPATKVTIYGANAINNAFAGGNGAGQSTNPSAPNYNPGADVGYFGYYSQTGTGTPTYGTGETDIKIYGGTINNVYGGSNNLGYIRTHAYVEVLNVDDDDTEHKDNICDLHLGEVHAGGNQAEMYCGGSVTLSCSEGADVVYAGSSDADIHGDIDLIITSGTFGKVFGGNNQSGNVYGSITINIDETGCWPVMIGELYACGNKAAYSVYGYNDDGSCKTDGSPLHTDPTINLISFTRIGKVFGGGFGETAVVYGNTKVNVDPIKGIFAGKTTAPIYVLNDKDQRKLLSETATLPYGITKTGNTIAIPDEVGSIGTIYGGGNAGAVYGNTEVNIGLKTTNKHYKDKDKDSVEPEDVAVTITGDVFGGGNEAIVSGDTNVIIGEE